MTPKIWAKNPRKGRNPKSATDGKVAKRLLLKPRVAVCYLDLISIRQQGRDGSKCCIVLLKSHRCRFRPIPTT
jgi:hypothetical protein